MRGIVGGGRATDGERRQLQTANPPQRRLPRTGNPQIRDVSHRSPLAQPTRQQPRKPRFFDSSQPLYPVARAGLTVCEWPREMSAGCFRIAVFLDPHQRSPTVCRRAADEPGPSPPRAGKPASPPLDPESVSLTAKLSCAKGISLAPNRPRTPLSSPSATRRPGKLFFPAPGPVGLRSDSPSRSKSRRPSRTKSSAAIVRNPEPTSAGPGSVG